MDFIKKARQVGSSSSKASGVFFYGLLILKLFGRNLAESLINLMHRAVGKELFTIDIEEKNIIEGLNLVFEIKKIFLKLSQSFLEQNCCFLHFLLGQKRVMVKTSWVEKQIEKRPELLQEIRLFRAFLRKVLAEHADLENFLCFTTRFDEEERLHLDQCSKHQYFLGFDSETFRVQNLGLFSSFLSIFFKNENENVPQFFARSILKALNDYYRKGKRWFAITNPFNSPRDHQDVYTLNEDDPLLDFLAFEFGIDKDKLFEFLEQIINNSFIL